MAVAVCRTSLYLIEFALDLAPGGMFIILPLIHWSRQGSAKDLFYVSFKVHIGPRNDTKVPHSGTWISCNTIQSVTLWCYIAFVLVPVARSVHLSKRTSNHLLNTVHICNNNYWSKYQLCLHWVSDPTDVPSNCLLLTTTVVLFCAAVSEFDGTRSPPSAGSGESHPKACSRWSEQNKD